MSGPGVGGSRPVGIKYRWYASSVATEVHRGHGRRLSLNWLSESEPAWYTPAGQPQPRRRQPRTGRWRSCASSADVQVHAASGSHWGARTRHQADVRWEQVVSRAPQARHCARTHSCPGMSDGNRTQRKVVARPTSVKAELHTTIVRRVCSTDSEETCIIPGSASLRRVGLASLLSES